ncbi:MAG: YadA-like family protein [Alphaproteobacteria bacterium]|nr:YadA-like family protein [Alphaproteobacteria bacterium]
MKKIFLVVANVLCLFSAEAEALTERANIFRNNAVTSALLNTDSDLIEAINELDSTIGNVTWHTANGNLLAATSITEAVNELDTAIGNRNYTSHNYITMDSNVADALSVLDNAVGSAVKQQYNGVSESQSVNANIDAINSKVGNIATIKSAFNNLFANGQTPPANVVDALDRLDNAIGNRANIKSSNQKINQASASGVADGLQATGDVIGDGDFSSTYYASSAGDVSSAIRSLDQKIADFDTLDIDNRLNRLDSSLNDINKRLKRGLASMVALTALVPNARANGNTQLSFGTGAYDGHTGFALGGFHWFNDNLLGNAGVAYGSGGPSDVIYRAGVTYSW